MNPLRAAATGTAVLLAGAVVGAVAVAVAGPLTLRLTDVSLGSHPAALGLVLGAPQAVLLLLVTFVGALVAAFSVRFLDGAPRTGRYAGLLVATVVATAVMVTSASLPVLVAGWIAAGLLIAGVVGHRGDPAARAAARRMRWTFAVGDTVLVVGVTLLLVSAPAGTSLDLTALPALVAGIPAVSLTAAALCLGVAGAVRSAQLPAHRWLPETAAAPTPVSALLHAGLVNGAGVLALLLWPVYAAVPLVLVAVALLGLATAVVTGLQQRARADVKGRLAASTSAQMGYLGLQLGLGVPGAALLHVIGHGIFKAGLFLASGSAVRQEVAHRDSPAPLPARRRDALLWAALAAGVAVALAVAVAATVAPLQHGAASALLVGAAVVTAAALAARSLTSDVRRPLRSRAVAAAVPLGALVVYLVALGWFETTVAAGYAPVATPTTVQVALVVVAAVVALVAVGLDRLVRAGRLPQVRAWAVRASLPAGRRRRLGAVAPLAPARVTRAERARLRAQVERAAAVVVPTWSLQAFVATNPLGGLDHLDVDDAYARQRALRGTRAHLPLSTYRAWWHEGRITAAALEAAVSGAAARDGVDAGLLRRTVLGEAAPVESDARPWQERVGTDRTLADVVDAATGSDLVQRADDATAIWCAALWDDGESPWGPSGATADAFSVRWRHDVTEGREDGALGVRGFGAWVASLPVRDDEAVVAMLQQSGYSPVQWHGVLARTISRLPGWASHAALRSRDGGDDLIGLVVVRLAYETATTAAVLGGSEAMAAAAQRWGGDDLDLGPGDGPLGPLSSRAVAAVWREALEESRRAPVLAGLAAAAGAGAPVAAAAGTTGITRPDAQVVCCIDVRSEPLRRALEQAGAGRWHTLGFAGFFGVPLHLRRLGATGGSDQCPVLLTPRNTVLEVPADGGLDAARVAEQLRRSDASASEAWHRSENGAVTPFVLAESLGAAVGVVAAARTWAPRLTASATSAAKRRRTPDTALTVAGSGDGIGFTLDERVYLAEAALRTMGLVQGFGRLLVLTGHESATVNNPFGSGYDCGACGGNGGAVNARALAEVLRDPDVRDRLRERGIDIPDDTVVVGAVHDTTRDVVRLVDSASMVPASHRALLEELRGDLAAAGAVVAAHRLRTLPGGDRGRSATAGVARRAADWAQVRPEWGLVGNHAFIAAPRELSDGLDLDGRVFLHSYDASADPDGTALEVILTAPVVVAQWINAQYAACAIDPEGYGSGCKTVHNVVGRIGVVAGARGDLLPALPVQGVNDDHTTTRHEPLRLMVVAAALPDTIDRIVAAHDLLRRLLGNGWITLVSMSPHDHRQRRWTSSGWVPVSGAPSDTTTGAPTGATTGSGDDAGSDAPTPQRFAAATGRI